MGINDYIKIGKRIRKFRTEKGYSQKQMATLCGIPYSTYSNYENNNREPGMEQIEKIANVLEITTDELIGHIKAIDEFTINVIDNCNYQIIRLLKEKDELSIKQQILDNDYNPNTENEDERHEYACKADWLQFCLKKTLTDLNDFMTTIKESTSNKELSLHYEILLALSKLNPEGEKKILEEIENLSFNPKYQIPIKTDDWDAFDDI